MNKLVIAGALLLLAVGAQAAPVSYVLDSVTYYNTFAPTPLPVPSCAGCGTATAVDDGFGNLALSGISWGQTGQAVYTISFDATTMVGAGVTLNTTNRVCNQTGGTSPVCSTASVLSGLNFDTLYTGIGADNMTACANDRCRIDVSVSGPDLTVVIRRALSESTTSSTSGKYQLNFSVVPVPGAVWLLGSALGLLGFVRRRFA